MILLLLFYIIAYLDINLAYKFTNNFKRRLTTCRKAADIIEGIKAPDEVRNLSIRGLTRTRSGITSLLGVVLAV